MAVPGLNLTGVGAWTLLTEFGRISLNVLSVKVFVIYKQVLAIFLLNLVYSKSQGSERKQFEDI